MDLERKLNFYIHAKDEEELAGYINLMDSAIDEALSEEYDVQEIGASILNLVPATTSASGAFHDYLPVKGGVISKDLKQKLAEFGSSTYVRLRAMSKDHNRLNPVYLERKIVFSESRNGLLLEEQLKVKGNGDQAMNTFHVIEKLYQESIEKPSNRRDEHQLKKEEIKFCSPKEIRSKLDEYVIGQDAAKKGLAVAISNHYANIVNKSDVEKNNIMLVGPTGSGKTLLAKTISEAAQVPFITIEAPEYTSEGYVGKDIGEIFYELVMAANFDFKKAQKGIIYVDEIDKVRETFGVGPDVNGGGVQDLLLRRMEGSEIDLPIEKVDLQAVRKGLSSVETKKFNTKDVLFIFGGAFTDLDKIKAAAEKTRDSIGYGPRDTEKSSSLLVDILHQYGMKREFLGRIPTILGLNKLSVEEMKEILYKPKNAVLGQYQEMCKNQGIKLEVTDDGLTRIAEEAEKLSLGARSLRTVLDKVINPIIYEKSGSNAKVILDRKTIDQYIKD